MGILSTSAANSAKRAIEIALPDRCAIIRVTRTQDPTTGGYTESEATYASGIPCRVDLYGQRTPSERPVAGRESAVTTIIVMLSAHPSRWPGGVVDVRATDHLVITGEGAGTYEPIDAGGPVTDDLARSVPCNRITE